MTVLAETQTNLGDLRGFHCTTCGTGAVLYDLVHLVTAWPRPNIPVLVCQNDNLFSSDEYVTKFLPSGLNAKAVTGAP